METIKTQKKLENPVQPTYDHEDAVARAFMASNLIANIFLGNEGGDDQVRTNERASSDLCDQSEGRIPSKSYISYNQTNTNMLVCRSPI